MLYHCYIKYYLVKQHRTEKEFQRVDFQLFDLVTHRTVKMTLQANTILVFGIPKKV